MNPDEWKDFINGLFVAANGKRQAATITITIEAEAGKLVLPPLSVKHTDTLQQIFLKIDQLPSTEEEPQAEQQSFSGERKRAVNVEHIQHGRTEYLVYRMNDDSFQVVKKDGEIVTPKTIIYNTVVKKYREKFGLA